MGSHGNSSSTWYIEIVCLWSQRFLFVWWLHKTGVISQQQKFHGPFGRVKHCLDFFLCIFSSITCLKKPVFSKGEIFCGGRYQPGCIGIFWLAEGIPASLSLVLKSEKIPALLYWGEGPMSTGPSVVFDLLAHISQIREGPVLRPFSYENIIY
jgi:hypothetical protein